MSEIQPVVDAVAKAMRRAGIPFRGRILVAVSGGPDSVALLDVLHNLAARPDHVWSLRIGHVNHGLRGPESDQDEQFVRDVARACDLPADMVRVATREYAQRHKVSIETAARVLRAGALREMLASWAGDCIALGHTQDDQAESVLLHLLRGAGLTGLAAMRERSGPFVRPLLRVSREEVIRYLQERRVGFRLDSSNRDVRFRRNMIRRRIVPALEMVQPRVVELLARTASLVQADLDFIEAETNQAIELLETVRGPDEISASRAVWRSLPLSLRRHVLRELVRQLYGELDDVDESHLTLLCDAIEMGMDRRALLDRLPHGLSLYLDGTRFALRRGRRPTPPPFATATLEVPGSIELPAGTLSARVLSSVDSEERERLIAVCGPLHAFCDAERIGPHLLVRSRRPGDRLRPLGAPGSRKLQDIMVDKKVPAGVRNLVPVVESEGQIVWVPGIALDQQAAVTGATSRVVHLCLRPRADGSVLECDAPSLP